MDAAGIWRLIRASAIGAASAALMQGCSDAGSGGEASASMGSSGTSGTQQSPSSTACPAQLGVAYRIYTFPGDIKAAVWYPTTAPEAAYSYSADTASTLALNAPPATCARFPLVVFSHGAGGCGTQSLFLTESLARQGYVVVAPDHDDAICSVDGVPPSGSTVNEPAFNDPMSWTDATYASRRQDVQTVLDAVLTDSPWRAQIDADRIGIAGHSLGGYTVVGLAGGWASWADPRVKAVLALSPYVYPFLVKNLLGNVRKPLTYQGAQFDLGITPSLKGPNGAYALANAPKMLAELAGGGHFEWTNVVCLSTQTIQNCLQTCPNTTVSQV
jgi:predicted dienelactone hydrolase